MALVAAGGLKGVEGAVVEEARRVAVELATAAMHAAMQRHDLAQLQSAIAAAEEVGGMEEAAVMKEAKVRVVHVSFMLFKYGIRAQRANRTSTLHK